MRKSARSAVLDSSAPRRAPLPPGIVNFQMPFSVIVAAPSESCAFYRAKTMRNRGVDQLPLPLAHGDGMTQGEALDTLRRTLEENDWLGLPGLRPVVEGAIEDEKHSAKPAPR